MTKTWITGLNILAAAIVMNWLAGLLGLTTWHALLSQIRSVPIDQLVQSVTLLEWVFLLAVYPYVLGFAAKRVC